MNLFMLPLAKTFSEIFYKKLKKVREDKSGYILYKIVDSHIEMNQECYKIQCIGTKAIFSLTLHEIVFDLDILHGLHPIQGCYIGIEYAKMIKGNADHPPPQEKHKNIISKYSTCRYGNNILLYQDRNGLLGFECKNENQQFLMDPRDIALSRELIEEFDAAQAFCIGVLAGLKFVNPVKRIDKITRHLRLV